MNSTLHHVKLNKFIGFKNIWKVKSLLSCAFLIGIFLLNVNKSAAQGSWMTGYTYSQSSGTYTSISGDAGKTTFQTTTALNTDGVSAAITLPFTFTYNLVACDRIYISNNGFITLANATTTTAPTAATYNPISAATGYVGAIAGYGFNLVASTVSGASGAIYYETVGATFIVEFKDVARTGIAGDRLQFQIRLNQTTNTIDIVYGTCAATTTTTTVTNFGQVGLRGSSSSQFLNRAVYATSPYNTWASSGAAVDNGATPSQTLPTTFNVITGPNCVRYNTTFLPASGLKYTWTPVGSAFYQALPYTQTFNTWGNLYAINDVPVTPTPGVITNPAEGTLSWRNVGEAIANSGWYNNSNGVPTLGASNGAGAASFFNYAASVGAKGYMDFYLNFSSAGSKSLTFDLINADPATVKVYLSTDGGVTFGSALATYSTAVTSWTTQAAVSLGSSTSVTCVLRFEATGTDQNNNVGIDNLTVSVPVSAPSLTATTSPTSVDNNFTVTYATNLTYTSAITTIQIGGSTLTLGTDYSLSGNNTITFTPTITGNTTLHTPGTYTITVNATGYNAATVSQILTVGADAKLVVTTPPGAPATNGALLGTQPVVKIQDKYGNATTSTAAVSASPSGGTWTIGGGLSTVNAVSGTATFSGLTASSPAAVPAATITFTSGSASVVSSSFPIPAPPPVNDECTGAISLTPSTTCSNTSGTNVNATQSSIGLASCGAGGTPIYDVWYSFTVPSGSTADYTVSVDPTASQSWIIALYSGSCASLTELGCNRGSNTGGVASVDGGNLAPGNYYYRVYGRAGVTSTFTTCVTYVNAPIITSFTNSPSCAGSGATVIITGSNFTGATDVSFFNAQTATFTVTNSTTISATLPDDATTGPISVTTPGGTVTSSQNFTVNTRPTGTINTQIGTAVCAGSSVNITGTVTATGPWTLSLTGSGGTASGNGNGTFSIPLTSPASATFYTISTLSDAVCSSIAADLNGSATISPIAKPTVTASASPSTICAGSISTLAANSPAQTSAGYSVAGVSPTAATSNASILGPNPFQNYYGGSKQQMLYTAAELSNLGLINGSSITGIAVHTNANAYALQNLRVKIQNTALSALTTTFITTGFTTVFGPVTYTPTAGANTFNTITFTSSFTWNGTSNLLIEINYTNNDGGAALANRNSAYYGSTSFVSSALYRADNTTAAAMDAVTTASFTYSARTNLAFFFSTTPSITWSPVTDLYTNSGATTAYTGTNAATVYAKPSTTTNYTATAAGANSCTSASGTGNVTVTVRPVFTAGAISTTGETICSGGNPAVIGSVTPASGGDNVITYKWQANGVDIAGTNAATYDPPTGLITNTTYTRYAHDGTCNATFTLSSGSYMVTVRPVFTAGAISTTGETICSGGDPAVIGSVTPASGGDNVITYKWQANGVDIPSTNTATYDPPSGLITNTTYTRFAKDNTCNTTFTLSSGSYVVTVRPVFTAGAISTTGETICSGGNPAVIGSVTPASGGDNVITYKWQANGVDIAGTNAATYDPPTGLITNTTYTRYAHDGTCNATFTLSSGSYMVTVRPVFTAGAISTTGETICSGGNPAVIGSVTPASGGDNVITYKWQANGVDIPTTNTATYDPPSGLITNTTYTRYAHDGTCNATFTLSSGSYMVTVRPVFTAGAISTTGETICSGGNPSIIGSVTPASGGDNVITYKWQANGVDIPSTNTATYDPPAGLTSNTTYTRYAHDGTCNTTFTLSSGSYMVTVTPTVGTPSTPDPSASTICQASAPTTYTTSATDATSYTWSISGTGLGTTSIDPATGTVTWDPAFYGTATISVVANGCNGPSAPASTTVTVRQTPAVSISGTTTICSGSNATISFTGTPGTAVTFSDGSSDYSINLDGTTGTASNPFGPLTATTTYSLEFVEYPDEAPACKQTATGSAVVTVNQQSANPTSATASLTTICNDGSSSTVLTLNGGGGGDNETIHWYSGSCGGTPVGTGNNLAVSPTTTTTYYGRYEDGAPCNYNSACASVTITVNQQSANPTSATASSTTICLGSSTNLILNGGGGGTGEVIHWYTGSCGGTSVGTGNNLSVSPTATTTYYGRYEDGAPCSFNTICQSVTITVTTPPSATISYGVSPYCSNGGTATVTQTGTPNGTYSSTTGLVIDAGSGDVDLGASTAGTYTVTYTVAASGGCAIYTTTASITITEYPAGTIAYATPNYCPGTGTATIISTITPSGTTGTYTATPAGLSINSSTGAVDLSLSTSGTYTVTFTVAPANGCAMYQASTTITINIDTWNGSSNTDWNDPANWSCGSVPTINSDAVIPTGVLYYPSVATVGPPATVHNLTINAGASLTVTAQTLQVSAGINNSGIFDVSIGTLELNGKDPQSIPALAFTGNKIRNLIISNDVSLNGQDSLSGVLSFGASSKTFTTNNNLTLKSNISRTGSVGIIDNGNAISGNVTVERFIATGTGSSEHAKSWQLMAVPTTGGQTIRQSWMENASASNVTATQTIATNPVPGYGTMTTSNVANAATFPSPGFDAYTSPGPTVKTYNYATNDYSGTATTNVPVYDKRGYFVFVRGDRSVYTSTGTADHTILRTTGTLITPAVTQPVSTVPSNYFQSIGNPFASAVDMTKISVTGGNSKQYFYVWDPRIGGTYNYGVFVTFQLDATGNYEVQTNGGGSYPANGTVYNYLQNGQAFFMQADATGPGIVSFPETSKAPEVTFPVPFTRQGDGGLASTSGARTSSAQGASLRTGLHIVNADGSTGSTIDETLNQFDDTYSNGVDGFDGRKMLNTGENLSIRNSSKLLAIEKRHTVIGNDTIFLNLTSARTQAYQFSIDAANLATVDSGFVVDKYLNTRRQINLKGNTKINFNVTGVAASYAPDRFMLVFVALKVLPTNITSVTAYQQSRGSHNINVDWSVNNEHNIQKYVVERSADSISFTKLTATKPTANDGSVVSYSVTDTKPVSGNNYYRIKMTDTNGNITYSTIVSVNIGAVKNNINIYPNPVTDGRIHLQFSNEAAGKYGIRLLNKKGEVIVQKQVTRQQGSNTELLQWNYNLAHGMYQVEITRPDGTVKNIDVLY